MALSTIRRDFTVDAGLRSRSRLRSRSVAEQDPSVASWSGPLLSPPQTSSRVYLG